MNNQKTVKNDAGERITVKELLDKVKTIFNLDEIESHGNVIYVNSTYDAHLFTFEELKPLFDLAVKYDFKISFLEKDEYRTYTCIMINLEDSFIIL